MRTILTMAGLAALVGVVVLDEARAQTCSVTEVAPGVKMRTSNCLGPARPAVARRTAEPLALAAPEAMIGQPFAVIGPRSWPADRSGNFRVRQ
jgi:hypothetical protein